jgi:hypothetical protein
MTQGVINEVVCLVEERKMVPKFKSQQPHITVHNTGHNSRANFNGVDQSVNDVTITEQNVFATMRDIVAMQIPEQEQAALLERIKAMEVAVNKPAFRERYQEWASIAATHLALFQFCIPRLVDLTHKAGLLNS